MTEIEDAVSNFDVRLAEKKEKAETMYQVNNTAISLKRILDVVYDPHIEYNIKLPIIKNLPKLPNDLQLQLPLDVAIRIVSNFGLCCSTFSELWPIKTKETLKSLDLTMFKWLSHAIKQSMNTMSSKEFVVLLPMLLNCQKYDYMRSHVGELFQYFADVSLSSRPELINTLNNLSPWDKALFHNLTNQKFEILRRGIDLKRKPESNSFKSNLSISEDSRICEKRESTMRNYNKKPKTLEETIMNDTENKNSDSDKIPFINSYSVLEDCLELLQEKQLKELIIATQAEIKSLNTFETPIFSRASEETTRNHHSTKVFKAFRRICWLLNTSFLNLEEFDEQKVYELVVAEISTLKNLFKPKNESDFGQSSCSSFIAKDLLDFILTTTDLHLDVVHLQTPVLCYIMETIPYYGRLRYQHTAKLLLSLRRVKSYNYVASGISSVSASSGASSGAGVVTDGSGCTQIECNLNSFCNRYRTLIYSGLLSGDVNILNLTTDLITGNKATSFKKEEDRQLHNSFIMDIINMLWKNKFLCQNPKPNSIQKSLFLMTSRLKLEEALFLGDVVNIRQRGSLAINPATAYFAVKVLRFLEDSSETLEVRHEGPITCESITLMNTNYPTGWLSFPSENLKLQILYYMEQNGFMGLPEFFFNSLRSLLGRRTKS